MIIMMIIIITIIFHVGFGNFTFIGMAIKSIVISFNETVPYKIYSVSFVEKVAVSHIRHYSFLIKLLRICSYFRTDSLRLRCF